MVLDFKLPSSVFATAVNLPVFLLNVNMPSRLVPIQNIPLLSSKIQRTELDLNGPSATLGYTFSMALLASSFIRPEDKVPSHMLPLLSS